MVNSESSKKRTILAVDDKIENLKVLISYLEDSGFDLMVAQSGEEAFEHIERVIPDMILLDVLMPGIDGFETCRRLKKNPATKDIPVIFMTALTETTDKVKGFKAGAIDYLTKPLQHEEVLARVNAHMNTVEFQEQLHQKNVILHQKITAFSMIMQMESYAGPVIAKSAAMQKLKKQLGSLSAGLGPILITGEPGTGQVYIARKIHERLSDPYAPLIVVNCSRVEDHEASQILFGSAGREGLNSHIAACGALHLADQGTLILMNIEALDINSQKNLSRYLQESLDSSLLPQINLILTSCDDISAHVSAGRFLPALADQISKNKLKMPNLVRRRRDILPLARLFLSERNQRVQNSEFKLTRSAEHALLSRQYRNRNIEELREAIESAALFSDSPDISAEHIFTGPKSEGTHFEFDLSRFKLVKWLLTKERPLSLLQSVVFILFLAICLICFIVPDSRLGQMANSLIWGLWEPMLIVGFLFVGRVWCTVCPLSSAGRLAQQAGCFKIDPPPWLRENAGWLMVALFFLIIWSEHVFHMTEKPFGTSILLLSLIVATVLFAVMYQREIWCRYLCPLGNLGAAYALAAPVYLRANPGVCATECNTHECFKGSTDHRACPVYHHPLYTRDAQLCKLCFSCLRSCPHGSVNLYLRIPVRNVWQQSELSATLTPLALSVFFLAIVLLMSRNTTWLEDPYVYTVAALLALILGIIVYIALPKLLCLQRYPEPALVSRLSLAFFLLGWGPFMAYHLQQVPLLNDLQIRVLEGSVWASFLAGGEVTILLILQITVIMLAGIIAHIIFWHIWKQYIRRVIGNKSRGWWVLMGIGVLYLMVSTGIVLI